MCAFVCMRACMCDKTTGEPFAVARGVWQSGYEIAKREEELMRNIEAKR